MGTKFVISSLSASGKTTLVNELLKLHPEMYRLKTSTSRAVRPEEKGDEYYFFDKHEMELRILSNEFVEHSVVYGHHYGLSKDEVNNNADKNVLIILDVQGMKKFKKQYPDAVTIFIEPPPVHELVERLKSRNTSDEDVHKRINEFRGELKYMKKYDIIIPNGKLDDMTKNFVNAIEQHLT